MSASKLAAAAFVLVVLAWVGLSAWGQIARSRLDRTTPEVATAFEAHAAPYTERGELPPPAYWDFRRRQVVEYPPGAAETVSSDPSDPQAPFVMVVRADADTGERWPVWMWGLWLGTIPPAVFHGVFGTVSVSLFALWLRLRSGSG